MCSIQDSKNGILKVWRPSFIADKSLVTLHQLCCTSFRGKTAVATIVGTTGCQYANNQELVKMMSLGWKFAILESLRLG